MGLLPFNLMPEVKPSLLQFSSGDLNFVELKLQVEE